MKVDKSSNLNIFYKSLHSIGVYNCTTLSRYRIQNIQSACFCGPRQFVWRLFAATVFRFLHHEHGASVRETIQ